LDFIQPIAICKINLNYLQKIVRKLSILTTLVGIVAVSFAGAPAMADPIIVTTTLGKSCTAPSNYTINLPAYDGTDRPGSADIKFRCTKNTHATIELFPGNGSTKSSSGTLKLVSNPTTTPISYTIQNERGGLIDTFIGIGSGLSASAPKISAETFIHPNPGQDPVPGRYEDTIGIKVTY
jgi:spore coat protein U-like protein